MSLHNESAGAVKGPYLHKTKGCHALQSAPPDSSILPASPKEACQTHSAISAPVASCGAICWLSECTLSLTPCSSLTLSTRLPPKSGTSVLPAPSSFALSFLAPSTCKHHGGHLAGAAVHAGSAKLVSRCCCLFKVQHWGSLPSGEKPAAASHRPVFYSLAAKCTWPFPFRSIIEWPGKHSVAQQQRAAHKRCSSCTQATACSKQPFSACGPQGSQLCAAGQMGQTPCAGRGRSRRVLPRAACLPATLGSRGIQLSPHASASSPCPAAAQPAGDEGHFIAMCAARATMHLLATGGGHQRALPCPTTHEPAASQACWSSQHAGKAVSAQATTLFAKQRSAAVHQATALLYRGSGPAACCLNQSRRNFQQSQQLLPC